MAFLRDTDRRRIEAAIREAEAKTSGEFVCVIARASDTYLFLPTLCATAAALTVPLVLWLLRLATEPLLLFQIQFLVFAAVAAGLRWAPATMLVIPPAIKRQRARRLAREQFFALGLHGTRGRTGVLLFVSIAEHYVEILADRGIDAKVPPGAWDAVVADFIAKVKAGCTADGFLAAVAACGALLAEHFPRAPDDRDELPNVLIEI